LWARNSLEQALQAFGGTLIFVSHDRYFLDQLATRVLVWEPDRWRLHDGNYSEYVDFRKRVDSQPAEASRTRQTENKKEKETTRKAEPATRTRKFPFRKLEEIEADIAAKEEQLAAIEADMMLPDTLR